MRRLLPALLLLACAAPAQAAPRPLVYSHERLGFALAGERAVYTRGSGAFSVPLAGDPARRVFSHHRNAETPRLAASATRAAIIVLSGEPKRVQVFSGPPAGPWAALTPPSRAGHDPAAFSLQVDGDRLFTLELRNRGEDAAVTVRDPDAHIAPFPTGADAIGAVFAGDLVAYGTGRRFVVRDWRTGAERTVAELPDTIAGLDLRPDGRAVAATDDGELFDVPPGGPPRRLTRAAGKPRFAGDHIVFVRGSGPGGGGSLRVIDPGGTIRPFGVSTDRLGEFTTDSTNVLWEANGCLLVAPVSDAHAAAPAPGQCPRSELTRIDGPSLILARTIPVTLRCVAAPRACRGTFRLTGEDGRPLSRGQRFSIPAGRARRLSVRLDERRYEILRRLVAGDEGTRVSVDVRIDGHRIHPSGPDVLVLPRRG